MERPINSEMTLTPIDGGKNILIQTFSDTIVVDADLFRKAAAELACPPELDHEWFPTFTGIKFDIWNPTPDMVRIEDIAHHLSNICRFSGACRHHYSVAQHSVMVSEIVPEELALLGLMHDAPKAYCNDMIRGVKRGLAEYRLLEERIWLVVAEKFGLPIELPPEIKRADNIALSTERRDLITKPFQYLWRIDEMGFHPLKETITPWSPQLAEEKFLNRFEALTT